MASKSSFPEQNLPTDFVKLALEQRLAYMEIASGINRDGRWVYFSSNRAGLWQIWKIPSGGGKAIQVTDNGGFVAFESADGKDLVYTKHDGVRLLEALHWGRTGVQNPECEGVFLALGAWQERHLLC